MSCEVQERDELRTPTSPAGLEVVQITSDESRGSNAFYVDCQSWSNDGKILAYHRNASDDGSRKAGFWICDVENGFETWPVYEYDNYRPGFEERGTSEYGCVLARDGSCAYLLDRQLDTVGVSRLALDGSQRKEPLCTAPAPWTARGAMSTSADGERVLMGCFLGDGRTEGAPWGAYIFDVSNGACSVVEFGNGFRNMHCQYSNNPDPDFSHDILLCASHEKFADGSWLTPPDGSWRWRDLPEPIDRKGGAHHVVRDDGTDWRMLPVGRRHGMVTGGHCTWRGDNYSVCAAVYHTTPDRWRSPIMEAGPTRVTNVEDMWLGGELPGAESADLSRRMTRADTCHLGMDAAGRRYVSDTEGYNVGEYSFLYVGRYIDDDPAESQPYLSARYLLLPRTSWKNQEAHPHAILSPDGRYVVFNSDFTGRPQVYMAYNFDY